MLDVVEPFCSVVWKERVKVALDLFLIWREGFRRWEEEYVVREAHHHTRESDVGGLMLERKLF